MATKQAVRLDFDMGGGARTPKPQPGAPRDRPWRKSKEAVTAERQEVTVTRTWDAPACSADPVLAPRSVRHADCWVQVAAWTSRRCDTLSRCRRPSTPQRPGRRPAPTTPSWRPRSH